MVRINPPARAASKSLVHERHAAGGPMRDGVELLGFVLEMAHDGRARLHAHANFYGSNGSSAVIPVRCAVPPSCDQS